MITIFETPDSKFKRYPLIGAPFFIEFDLLVLSFERIATQFSKIASSSKLSCKILDAMIDFRPND